MNTWYNDLQAMEEDDKYLQSVYRQLQADLAPDVQSRIPATHIYPSRKCTYTIAKQRIFVKVRDAQGRLLPECALRHVLLHELAHVINPSTGHDNSFYGMLKWISSAVASCPSLVPRNFNPCH
jgi:predicted metal-dependent hydrolase